MKKMIAIMLSVMFFAALSGSAFAGGRGGYHGHGGYGAGGFIAGLLGGAILGTVLSHAYEPVYVPAPRVYSAPPPEQVWVPGRYELRYERHWVPGHWEMERNSRYEDEDDDGYNRGRKAWVPGRYEETPTRVWLPGHWEERG